ncbi:hypothetical protein [Reticulibacter mediterranei]|nr:hypothetical protein [Reticulibacter mediterranei]
MSITLEQVATETVTTKQPQVVLSALDPQEVYEAVTNAANTSQTMRELHTTKLQTSLFPDLVAGLCQRLWDNQVQFGSGDPFDIFLLTEDTDLEELAEDSTENIVVRQALERLIPLSTQREKKTSFLIDAYCAGAGCELPELRTLGLRRSLSRQDQLDLLIALLKQTSWPRQMMRGTEETSDSLFPLPRLIMHIDRIQYIAHCSPTDVAQYTAALTYMIEALGDGFTLWLNIDDDDPSFPEEVKRALGQRFLASITHDLTAAWTSTEPAGPPTR